MNRRTPALTPVQQTTARIAAAVRVGLFVVAAPTALLSAIPPVTPARVLPVLAVCGGWVVVFAAVAAFRGLLAWLVAADIALTATLCLFNGWLVPLQRIGDGSGWVAVMASFCVITVAMAWRARVALPAGLLVVAAFLVSFPLAGLPGHGVVHTAVLTIQLVCAAAVMAVVRRAGAAADSALAAANEARRRAAVAEARRDDESVQLRLLHDTALTTLTLIGIGTIARSGRLTSRAAADLAAIERIAVAQPAVDGVVPLDHVLVETVSSGSHGLTVEQALARCSVPAPVAEAFAGSVGEALRNIERHAGVTAATLRLTETGGSVFVEVADQGRGFEPSIDTAHRYGVRESIIGRMAGVGGLAQVVSAPGAGTRWTLRWPAAVTPLTSALTAVSTQRYARGTAIVAAVVAGTWHVVHNLTGTVVGWSQYRWPLLVVVAWLAVAALTGFAAADALGRGRRRTVLALLGIPTLLLCVLAVLAAAPIAGIFAMVNWALPSFGLFAMVLLWRWPLRWLVVALGVNWLVGLVVVLGSGSVDRIELSRYAMLMYGTAALQLTVAYGARALERTAQQAATATTEQAEVTTARLAADSVHADRQRRYREIGIAVRQMLTDLAEDKLDPTDPHVQRRCAVEAARLRRLIAEHDDVPSPLVHELRACADVAERRAVVVVLETAGTPPALPRQVRRRLTEAPMHLLAAARTQARVTVVSAVNAAEVEVSVVADTGGEIDARDTLAEGVAVKWSGNGETQWVRASWRDR